MGSFFILLAIVAVLIGVKTKDTFTPPTRPLTKEEMDENLRYMTGKSVAENRKYFKNRYRK